jgi:hypothetical protein
MAMDKDSCRLLLFLSAIEEVTEVVVLFQFFFVNNTKASQDMNGVNRPLVVSQGWAFE